jgi:DNA-binding IclR family transcriptional regulator
MPRSTVHRLLSDLVERRVLRRDGRRYRLGLRLLQLGEQVRRQLRLPMLADEPMRKLASDTQETVHLGILDESQVVYVAKMTGLRGLQMASHVGLHSPAQTTAMGKVLLASLPQEDWARRFLDLEPTTPNTITDRDAFVRELTDVRAQGFAFDREENEVGIRCVAAPVIDARGDVVAAVSLSGASLFVTEERQRSLVPAVIACARSISVELGAPLEAGAAA